ncbi:MAG TPA: molybdopterin-dependent oxidoreductase [Bacteroidales bacterium]|nr:molybdopterin-dependent oxidoreductase [Bacteroidales bacterium]
MDKNGRNSKTYVNSGKIDKMTRGEALMTMGAMAAGVPFLQHAVSKNVEVVTGSGKSVAGIPEDPVLKIAISELEYLTPTDKFYVQLRGKPILSEIPDDRLSAIGLTRDTWKLEIFPDHESNSELGNPLTMERGNALDWNDLMKLAEIKSVRFLHVLSCTNARKLYGMGLWEGVPLRDVFWLTDPKQNIRRIYYYGYHNDEPAQLFKSSLHISLVLEEAPGELPVILCYKLNGEWISHANGGPVRLFVPGYYSNRSIKWLQKIVVTNSFQANDTYAEANNDVEGQLKTNAKFIKVPEKVKAGEKFAVTGLAQVGISGLLKVQYMLQSAGMLLPENDQYLAKGDWKDAIILPPPENWGSDLQGGKLPPVIQFNTSSGQPIPWPIINTIIHWVFLEKVDKAGEYELRCRTIDANGIAQPMPRPFGRSGVNRIEVAKFISE